MDPSAIFAIAAGAIIIVGRAINRIAEKRGVEVEDTTHSFDAQHEFDGEEAIPARQFTSDDDALAGTILGQIIAEGERRIQRENKQFSMPTRSIPTPQFVSHASATPKPAKPAKRAKPKAKPQPKRAVPVAPTSVSEPNTSEVIDDFDLRKAVIYSEILKPKFDE